MNRLERQDTRGRSAAAFASTLVATLIVAALVSASASAARIPGIDVSRFQAAIDWTEVAADGKRFAIVQASRGDGGDCTVKPGRCGTDEYYDGNYAAAKAAGIVVGPYHRAFVGGDTPAEIRLDARLEAAVFIESVGALKGGDLRPALDVETPFADLSPLELQLWVRVWLRKVGAALHAEPIIYSNKTSWAALGDTTEFALAGHPFWVANWDVPKPAMPAMNWAGHGWKIWQHSSTGEVDGITGNVDLDLVKGRLGPIRVRSTSTAKRGS